MTLEPTGLPQSKSYCSATSCQLESTLLRFLVVPCQFVVSVAVAVAAVVIVASAIGVELVGVGVVVASRMVVVLATAVGVVVVAASATDVVVVAAAEAKLSFFILIKISHQALKPYKTFHSKP